MTRLKPGRVRMPFPHLTLVSRSLTCQRSLTMPPALPLQVSLLSRTFLLPFSMCSYLCTWLMRRGNIIFYISTFCDYYLVTSKLRTWRDLLCSLWKSNCWVSIMLAVIRAWVPNLLSAVGASRSSATTPKSSTPTSRPSSAKKIPVPSTPAKGEKELEAQVTQLTEQVCFENHNCDGYTFGFSIFCCNQQSDHPAVFRMLLNTDSNRTPTNEFLICR